MSRVEIRLYKESDLDICRELWLELTLVHRSIYNDPAIGGDDPGAGFDKHVALAGPKRIWVAEAKGEVIGMVGLLVGDEEAEIEPLVVAEAYQGKGIGRALLDHAVEEANKTDIKYLSVKPVARNTEAISFFHHSGFGTVGHIQLFMDLKGKGTWIPELEIFGNRFNY